MTADPTALYLDLLKKALSYSLWPEPPAPAHAFDHQRSPLGRRAVRLLSRLAASRGLQLVQPTGASVAEREEGKTWPGYADTMVGMRRLDNLQHCVETALRDGVAGDLIETGVWRGGSCIFMRGILAAHGATDRKVYVADSFAGLPPPNPDYPADAGDNLHTFSFLAVSQEQVAANFARYGLLDEQVVFLKGWFSETLPTAPIEQLAVLRLDGDMYESTWDALTNLYPKLADGGFCIVDDYALETCRKAIADYRAQHGITDEIATIDWTGAFWRKGSGAAGGPGVGTTAGAVLQPA
jgi:O-methyltransferase